MTCIPTCPCHHHHQGWHPCDPKPSMWSNKTDGIQLEGTSFLKIPKPSKTTTDWTYLENTMRIPTNKLKPQTFMDKLPSHSDWKYDIYKSHTVPHWCASYWWPKASKTSLSSQGSNSASSSFISSCGLTRCCLGLGKTLQETITYPTKTGEDVKSWTLLSALIGWDMGTVPRRVSCIC